MNEPARCPICGNVINVDARGGPHPSPGDHDTWPHVRRAYGLTSKPEPFDPHDARQMTRAAMSLTDSMRELRNAANQAIPESDDA